MTGRVLIVDDIPANVKLLEARLSAEYFDVVTAASGAAALEICERAPRTMQGSFAVSKSASTTS